MKYLLVTLALLAGGAVGLGLLSPAEEFTLTDVSAMRITDVSAKRLPVHRITCDGVVTVLPADPSPVTSVVRVDLEINGKHVTIWARDD